MRITQYLTMTCTLEVNTESSPDRWGTPQYDPPETIKCRRVTKQKLARKKQGYELIAVTKYMTERQVRVGDKLDGQEVKAVEEIADLKKVIGYNSFPVPPSGFGGS